MEMGIRSCNDESELAAGVIDDTTAYVSALTWRALPTFVVCEA